jgi:hypothetical protein
LIIETAIKVRESKQYKGLPYIRDGVSGNISTFDEFCEVFLGKTGRRIRDLINNHNLLGEDLYEQAERLGFRQRDYNALKALPADDRVLIAQAIEAEDLDKALDMMQTMAARHFREKEEVSKQLAEKDLSLEAKDRVISDKTQELNKKSERIARLETAQQMAVQEVDMIGEAELMALHDYTRGITAKIEASLRSHIVKLINVFDGIAPKHIELAIAQSLGLIITAAYGVAGDLYINPIIDADTAADDPAKAEAEKFMQWDAEGGDITKLMDAETLANYHRVQALKTSTQEQ